MFQNGIFLKIQNVILWSAFPNPIIFNFITPAHRYTQWLPIPSVSIMLHIDWSAFLEGISNLLKSQLEQWHQWRVPIWCGDLRLLPLLCGLLSSWLLQGCLNWWFLPSPTPPNLSRSVDYNDIKKNGKIP